MNQWRLCIVNFVVSWEKRLRESCWRVSVSEEKESEREKIYFSTFPQSLSFPFFIFIHWHSYTRPYPRLSDFPRARSLECFPLPFFPRLCYEFFFFICTHSNRVITTPSFPFLVKKTSEWMRKYSLIIVFSTISNRTTRKCFQKIPNLFSSFFSVISHSPSLWQVSKLNIFLPFSASSLFSLIFHCTIHESHRMYIWSSLWHSKLQNWQRLD